MNTPPDTPTSQRVLPVRYNMAANRRSCPPAFFLNAESLTIPLTAMTSSTHLQERTNIVKKKMSTLVALERASARLVRKRHESRIKDGAMCFESHIAEEKTSIADHNSDDSTEDDPQPPPPIAVVDELFEKFCLRSSVTPFQRYFNENLIECIFVNYKEYGEAEERYYAFLLHQWDRLSEGEKQRYKEKRYYRCTGSSQSRAIPSVNKQKTKTSLSSQVRRYFSRFGRTSQYKLKQKSVEENHNLVNFIDESLDLDDILSCNSADSIILY